MFEYANRQQANVFTQEKPTRSAKKVDVETINKMLESNVTNFSPFDDDVKDNTQPSTQKTEEWQMESAPGSDGTTTHLPGDVKSQMEASFDADFDNVKIHRDSEKASIIGAKAYAQGNEIHFAPGQYNPQSTEGKKLIGHELAHIEQQRNGGAASGKQKKSASAEATADKEADEKGNQAAQGKKANVKGSSSNILQLKTNNFGPGEPPNYTVQISFSYVGGKMRINLNFTAVKEIGDFSGSYGFGVTYYSNFLNTGKKGFEMRNSLMLGYEDAQQRGVNMGTNLWTGFGEMSEFNQRTGFMSAKTKNLGFSYENDGAPFGKMGLGDGGDSYRTAAASIQIGELSLNTNLFTGLRNELSFFIENYILPGGKMGYASTGKFGEEYTHGLVYEQGPRYRYGGLTMNYKGKSFGIDSDRWVRHPFQNILAHDIIKDQRQFEVLTNDINNVYNAYPFGLSKFTLWGE